MKRLFFLMLTIIMSAASWSAEPYFEVTDGSFASGNVTLKITFPEATTVSIASGNWNGLSLYHPDNATIYSLASTSNYMGTHAVAGNTITATFSDFTPISGDMKYYVRSYDLTVDGSSYSEDIYAKEAQPYAEVVDGSFESGRVTAKVTVPFTDEVVADNYSFVHFLYYDGVNVTTEYGASNIISSGNTYTITFDFTSQGDDMSRYTVVTNSYSLEYNNTANNKPFVVAFRNLCTHDNLTHYDLVESTDLIQGHEAYDQCNNCSACFATDDTEHENALTAADFILPLDTTPIDYFYVENLEDGPSRAIAPADKNLECTTTPDDPNSWHEVNPDGNAVEGHGKMYYRATSAGNTNFAHANFRMGSDSYYPILDSNWDVIGWDEVHDKRHFAIGGDITTLLRSNGKVMTLPQPVTELELINDTYEEHTYGVFEEMFANDFQGWLQSAANLKLPSLTLSEGCYRAMFSQSSLTEGPAEISATTMAPYSCYEMFTWCNNLTVAPVIKAKTIAEHACEGMFLMGYGENAKLAIVPDLEVETVGEYSCANMFTCCVNLTKAPEIPATSVAPHCFENMFNDCSNLAIAPTILPATTLAEDCYKMMFYCCRSLERAPELPAPSLVEGCYIQMFENCTNLNYIKVGLMTEWPVRITYNEVAGYNEYDYYCTRNWVAGVNGDGTFCGPTCLFKEHYTGSTIYDAIPYYYNGYSYTRWASENPMTVPVTISSVGYSTFCYDYNWIVPEGTEGYIAYVDNEGNFHFEKGYEAGETVQSYRSPYNTYEDGNYITQWVCKAVVLKGAPGTYNIALTDIDAPVYDLESDPNYLNALYGSMHDFDISLFHTLSDDLQGITNSDYYYYALSLDEDGENVGFYWMEDDGAPFVTRPYKAFLRGRKDVISGVKSALIFDEAISETDRIEATDATPQKQHTTGIYDLSGRRVSGTQKGLYIKNGKKVLVN